MLQRWLQPAELGGRVLQPEELRLCHLLQGGALSPAAADLLGLCEGNWASFHTNSTVFTVDKGLVWPRKSTQICT